MNFHWRKLLIKAVFYILLHLALFLCSQVIRSHLYNPEKNYTIGRKSFKILEKKLIAQENKKETQAFNDFSFFPYIFLLLSVLKAQLFFLSFSFKYNKSEELIFSFVCPQCLRK